MKRTLPGHLPFLLALVISSVTIGFAEPIGTTFSYRGSLTANGGQANGTYDLKFTLFDSLANGTQVTATITNEAVAINSGLFDVALDFGPNAFTGEKRWLEIGVRTNTSSADFEVLAPRQELAPQPNALYAPSAGSAAVAQSLAAGSFSGLFSLTNPANSFSGDGGGLTNLNAQKLGGLTASDFWQLSGNSGTTAGVNFLGTTDNQPLELWVNGQRALRLEPGLDGTNGAPNIICGSSNNSSSPYWWSVTPFGATISGGASNSVIADYSTVAGGLENSVYSHYSTIGGGQRNLVGLDYSCDFGTIGGGFGNAIDSPDNTLYSTIGGGINNLIMLGPGTIGGGEGNFIDWGAWSTISGGAGNSIGQDGDAVSWAATIGGGVGNEIPAGTFSTIGGGVSNTVSANVSYGHAAATISGGESNLVGAIYGSIGGGYSNTVQTSAQYATIPGGAQASARVYGQMAYANGQFSSPGDAQTSLYVCRGATTNATQGELFLDGLCARMIVPTNSSWSFEILITGRASNGDTAGFRFLGTIKNNGGVLSLVGTPLKNALGQDVASWDANLSADSANQDLGLQVKGAAGTSIRWVANVRTSEVVF